ncbi:glycosyltransferase family 2 protein [Leptospira stimsonii]|uniref:Glycosyl transferase family 2 n=1 Tax=Leptospira stimsonii TaxID=2202203 RepID=A0A396ZCN0_9LEPT|nr:glycosyltransferase [Leptospira stimsonii]RHX90860.1 glycosyl transferase family 2 [Leptospira stimsonii]
MSQFFNSKDLCVLTPTKDRPNKIVNLLNSLTKQTAPVGRIIVVASGQDIRDVVEKYSKQLPLEYYFCEPPGQVRQRKLGVSKLDSRTKLVATLDDDIVLEPDAIERIVQFWNVIEPETAGVGFNIVNIAGHKFSFFKSLFYCDSKFPGLVLESGFPTSITDVKENVRTEWLNGGATIWRQDILIENIHKKDLNAKWAPCEDLIFSYPIGKLFPLYVCADSRVIHDDIVVNNLSQDELWYRGRSLAMWMIYFVSQNLDTLSIAKSSVALIAMSVYNLFKYSFTGNLRLLSMEVGRLSGLFGAVIQILRKRDVSELLR